MLGNGLRHAIGLRPWIPKKIRWIDRARSAASIELKLLITSRSLMPTHYRRDDETSLKDAGAPASAAPMLRILDPRLSLANYAAVSK